ncbi:MAG TPA: hypothetical protein VGZ32_10770 [Actinocrinis sp.]|jgi:hypothetical protein|uniref:hypothetical protein n=1 Tax=Actinocrinis sp. TaxID=1920516 RepID=UPI002DDD303E|nr:hypothetical protein [Actinocrinis sp.]HEV3170815.1 hypothetical protein [Actinocrinis sp.]
MNHTPPTGPFETEADARAAAQHIRNQAHETGQPGAMTRLNAGSVTRANGGIRQ